MKRPKNREDSFRRNTGARHPTCEAAPHRPDHAAKSTIGRAW